MLPAVSAIAPRMIDLIARTIAFLFVGVLVRPLERGKHLLIGEKPVSMRVVEIVCAILEENLQRLDRSLADEQSGRGRRPGAWAGRLGQDGRRSR